MEPVESNLSNAVVKRPFLITTVCLSVLGATTLVWTIFGSLKLESTGIGVILRGKHFVTISARTSGVIKRQYFELNDEVNEGQIVLSMASEIDKIRLEQTQKTIDKSKPLIKQSKEAGRVDVKNASDSILQVKKEIKGSMPNLKNLISDQEIAYNGLLKLYSNGQVGTQELANAFSSLSDLKQQKFELEQQLQNTESRYHQILQQNAQNEIQLGSDLIDNQSQKAQLLETIKQAKDLRAPLSGTIVSYNIPLGGFAQEGDPLITLSPSKGPLRAIVLVGAKDYGRIKVGDKALVSPSASPSIRFGYIKGRVFSKSKAPATNAELLKAFGSQETAQTLIDSFSRQGRADLPYLVDIIIDEKNKVPIWTLGKQPPWGVSLGSEASVRIISDEASPISLVIPFMRGGI